jgi:3-hydroxyacyl-CoA dehydrogenase/enoyl-CoA hydratase/3-hydroxybutyryl-CoA epimerase
MNDVASSLRLERRIDGCALLVVDVPGEAVNTLSAAFATELSRLLDEVERDDSITAVVVVSGKQDGFIAGADLKLLSSLTTADQARELSRSGQRSLERVARSRKPFVAAIHGACLGGGLEVALACQARVASSDERTKLGLPEVQLGLLPGLGGTQRLPRLVGIQVALDLMLTGRQLDARRALRAGLVDEVVARPVLEKVAVERALSLKNGFGDKDAGFSQRKLIEFALSKNPLGRKLVFDRAKQATLEKTHGNYPAPLRILEVVQAGLAHGAERGYELESAAFGDLVATAEARQLINLFFATNELKKDSGVDDPSAQPVPVHKVGVLGAGLMGAGIAYVTVSFAKLPVRIKDRDDASLGKGLAHVRQIFDGRVKSRRLTPAERDRAMSEVTASKDYSGFQDVELLIEAVFEDLTLKQRVLAEVEQNAPKAIFASNTSSLPLARIAEQAQHPERVVGMHYFSPVEKMPLLEVVVTERTAPWVTATAVAIGKRQGKTVIVVRDGPGFFTSRILGPYLNEASQLVAEGVPIERIDQALVEWGFPVGPLTLLDEVGLDVAAKVGKILHYAFGARMQPPPGVERLLADDRRGRKNARGFYLYGEQRKKGKKEVDPSVYTTLGVSATDARPSAEIAQRCALMFVNEAVRCFEEGILRSARDGDIGAVMGLGFPPFRGGPFRYADAVGVRELTHQLESFAQRYGERFAPAPLLVRMAASGQSFHGVNRPVPGNSPSRNGM